MIEYTLALLIGTLYGLFIGLVPAAGATTGLVALFPLLPFMQTIDPYAVVVFTMAVVASSTTGDTFASILLGIPGANSSAATMVDGFPLAKQGRASYALSAAVTSSTVSGILFGAFTFLLMPYYKDFLLLPATQGGIGQAEMFMFCVMAFVTVSFVSNKFWFRSAIALSVGIFLSLVGTDPVTAAPRFTMGWDFLQGNGDGSGISLIPIMAGIFAMPEMIMAWLKGHRSGAHFSQYDDYQIKQGFKDSFRYWKEFFRGGIIGSIIGFLPGLGGAISDWLAYSASVAANPTEKFGNGNIKGVIGPEGANNAQKATSMIPTVLFGIPGAPFAAVIIGLFGAVGFDLTLDNTGILHDARFFNAMSIGFLAASVLTGIICLLTIKYISRIAYLPFKYYFPILMAMIVWATYTAGFGTYGLDNVLLLIFFTFVGLFMQKFRFSRPALMIGFILGNKIEVLFAQTMQLFNIGGYPLARLIGDKGNLHYASLPQNDLLHHPTFIGITIFTLVIVWWAWRNKTRIDYS